MMTTMVADLKVHPFEDFWYEGEHYRYVVFEFKTPSTHEVTLYLDENDVPVSGEEIAYGGWYTYKHDEIDGLIDYIADHGIDIGDVIVLAKKKRLQM